MIKPNKIYLLCIIIFLVSCSNKSSEHRLNNLITTYENYKKNKNENYPLGIFTEERFEAYANFCDSLKSELNKINSKKLNEDALISHTLLDFILKETIINFKYKTHWNPILSDAGFHLSLTYRVHSITDKKSALSYLKLLKSIPDFINQQSTLIKKGIDAGISQPLIIFKGYKSTYEKHITLTAEENFYYSPFKNLPKQISNYEKDSLRRAAKEVVLNDVIPTFKNVKAFFENIYYPNTRKSIGVSETPNGAEYYQSRIDYYTTLNETPISIHEKGLKEVARIRKKMKSIVDELKFKGNLKQFIAFLRDDPQFYADSPEELLKHARNIAKKLDEQLPRYFKKLPRKPYGVAPVPEAIAPKYTGGRYVGTSPESTDPGYFWVNTYNLNSRPLYVIPSLTAHEAVPGHHLQGALNQELPETIPKFRRNLYLSAYGEGWGLYTEYLAEEMGIYTSPYEHFGKLTYEMWRACRLVVDTGIHAFGWPRDKAVNFMTDNTALSIHEVNTEIDRYISWPGQALSYKIGQLKIRELRDLAEEQMGDRFDIKTFHRKVLEDGALPLSILEKKIHFWIEQLNR